MKKYASTSAFAFWSIGCGNLFPNSFYSRFWELRIRRGYWYAVSESGILGYSWIQVLFLLCKIMQETFTHLWQSENDQFADNSEEDAEEVDTSLSSVFIGRRPLCNLWFADDVDLLGGSEINCNN